MSTMFTTSPKTSKLDEALAKAQGEIKTALKESYNPFFKNKYADLESVMDVIREPAARAGISYTQWPFHTPEDEKRVHLITRLALGEEWIQCIASIPLLKMDPPTYGAAVTYLRRFTLSAAFGVASGEGEDQKKTNPRPESEPITGDQLDMLNNSFQLSGWTIPQMREYLKKKWNVDASEQLPTTAFEKISNDLKTTFTNAMNPPQPAEEKAKPKNFAPGAKNNG